MAVYFTVTGTSMRYGTKFLEPGMMVTLVKEKNNEYDQEAIRAELPGMGKFGYVTNSVGTRIGDSSSAGRIYGFIDGDRAEGRVLYVLDKGVVCELAGNTICTMELEEMAR